MNQKQSKLADTSSIQLNYISIEPKIPTINVLEPSKTYYIRRKFYIIICSIACLKPRLKLIGFCWLFILIPIYYLGIS